jgi:hypothetical protein
MNEKIHSNISVSDPVGSAYTDTTRQKSRVIPSLPATFASQKVNYQQAICQNAIQLKSKYILILDADIILPLVLILRLLSLARETMLKASVAGATVLGVIIVLSVQVVLK